MSTEEISKNVIGALRKIHDPEIPVNIYDLGLIYEARVDDVGFVSIRMTLTAPNCPVAGCLPGEVVAKVKEIEGVTGANVELVFDPPWEQSLMSEAARLELGLGDTDSFGGVP